MTRPLLTSLTSLTSLGVLLAASFPAHAEDAETSCTAETGWQGCEDIALKLEPLLAGGAAVNGGTPTGIVFSPLMQGGSEQLFVARKDGTVSVTDLESGATTELISLDGVASVNPERGLLGLALAPDFLQSRTLYTVHTEPRSDEANRRCRRLPMGKGKKLAAACALGEELGCGGRFEVSEWVLPSVTPGEPIAPLSPRVVYTRPQPGEGHNAGHAMFGPDGLLYVSVGDGGAQMDPCGRGQDVTDVYGTVLRLDPKAADGVAAGNPLAGQDAEPAIWAYGLRNPWRMDFVPDGIEGVPAGTLIVADTGQSRAEEIDVIVGGGNYGWSVREGTLLHPDKDEAPPDPAFVGPLFQYGSLGGAAAPTGGAAVVGGVVYAGSAIPALSGHYLFGDNVSGKLWALDLRASDLADPASWNGQAKVHAIKGASTTPATWARDGAGEVYVGGSGGAIWKLVAE